MKGTCCSNAVTRIKQLNPCQGQNLVKKRQVLCVKSMKVETTRGLENIDIRYLDYNLLVQGGVVGRIF